MNFVSFLVFFAIGRAPLRKKFTYPGLSKLPSDFLFLPITPHWAFTFSTTSLLPVFKMVFMIFSHFRFARTPDSFGILDSFKFAWQKRTHSANLSINDQLYFIIKLSHTTILCALKLASIRQKIRPYAIKRPGKDK